MKTKILSNKTEKILNDLISEELKAMYAYKAIANWCQDAGFLSAYKYFLEESSDEKAHAEILEQYILDMGCVPELYEIDEPKSDFKTLYDVIYAAYDMEAGLGKKYSENASGLVSSDAMTFTKLQDFIKIQTESIGFYGDMCAVIKGLSDNKFEQLTFEKILVKN
jgi:ferritin